MKNKKIELALLDTGIRKYELARLMGVSESTLGRLTREELPDEKQEAIVQIIREEAKHRESNKHS